MRIDIHNHPDWYGMSPKKFVANMDLYGIDKTCLLSWDCPKNEYDPQYNREYNLPAREDGGPLPFERCVAYQEYAPERFLLGYAPDPRRPEAIDMLHGACKAYDIRVYGELKLRMTYDNPDALRMYRACGELDLAVLVHIDYEFDRQSAYPRRNYWYGGGLEAFARAVRACPGTQFIGHAPGFWCHVSGGDVLSEPYPNGPVLPGGQLIALLDECPNLHCDISAGSGWNALTRDKAFGRGFALAFKDRLMLGRDLFDNRHAEALQAMGLPQDALDKILYQNAARLLRL